MNPSDDLSLEELEARAASLEQELTALRSVITARRAQALYSAPTPQPVYTPEPVASVATPTPTYEAPVASSVRLCGYLSDGRLWNIAIPFTAISRPGGVTIGRSQETADIPLEDSSVSRCHTRLELTEQGLVVSDLGSTNGTYINSVPVPAGAAPRPLLDADTLTLGSINLRIDLIF